MMTPRAETLADILADILADVLDDSHVGERPTTDDQIVQAVIRLVDKHDTATFDAAIGPKHADDGDMIGGSLRRALREMRHDTSYYGDLVADWSDERINAFADGLCNVLQREWFGVC